MPETVEINGKIYTIELVEDGDTKYYSLKCGEEELRLSPNTTKDELESYADSKNRGHE